MGKRKERKINETLETIEIFIASNGPADFKAIYAEALHLKQGAYGSHVGYLALRRGVETERLTAIPYPKDMTEKENGSHGQYLYGLPQPAEVEADMPHYSLADPNK